MPYVPPHVKRHLDQTREPLNVGELNYVITRLCLDFIARQEGGLSYTNCNKVIGAMESAKLEFYRRLVAPYEDTKIEANGDVYTSG